MEEKIKRIIALALQLNPSRTQQEVTGSKPTVFVDFYGHVGQVEVRVYKNGWKPYADWDFCVSFDAEEDRTISHKKADRCIEYLLSLIHI